MAYTALYRKYRPARFEDVLGQEHIVRTLKNQLISGKVSHAYLFCGTRGTGKTSLAKIFAKAINCLSLENGEPCGKCKICCEIENGRSLNVIEIDAASNNGVENIREIREEVRYTPAEGEYKVYIIDEVHMLSASAYNAFLKTLEEPPAHVIFVLATTDPQKIPATVHSRCQRYDFKRISLKQAQERLKECIGLEGMEAEDDALACIARISDGSMRDALSLLDRCVSFFEGEKITLKKVLDITGSIDNKSFYELAGYLNDMDARAALSAVDKLINDGRDINRIIREAVSHFRNILIAKTVENPAKALDISEEYATELISQGIKIETPRIMAYISAFSELSSAKADPLNQRALLEIALIRLTNPEIINNSYEEIYGKLLELEKRLDSGNFKKISAKKMAVAPDKTESSEKAEPKNTRKVILPEDLAEAKARYGEVVSRVMAGREGHMLGVTLEASELGFLDDKSLYVIFNDEPNRSVLSESPKKLDMLKSAFYDVTGKEYDIKTICRNEFKSKSEGLEIVSDRKKKAMPLTESIGDIFEEFVSE